jgi:signal transduction histidine kinase
MHFWVAAQHAVKGEADLSHYTFGENGPAYLSGTWEFYWDKLLTPGELENDHDPELIHVPGSWHRQGDYSVLGVATYRLRVKLPKNHTGLSFYFPIINSAAKVWINGVLRQETGTVSNDPGHYRPGLTNTIVPVPENIAQLDLVVQVANYTYFRGGFGATPQLHRSSEIMAGVSRSQGIVNFFAGCLIAMCIYQLILFFLYHRGKPYLWLALICLGVALRALITYGGSHLLPNLYPSVSWEFWKKIEFGSVYVMPALFTLYVYNLFAEHSPKKPIYFFVGVSAFLLSAVIVTPQYVYGRLLEAAHISLLLMFVYSVYSIGRAWRAGNKDARIILFGVFASFPFIMCEILKNSLLYPLNIRFMYLVEMGVLVFLLFQVYLLANHYAKSYKNLEVLNLGLEKMVQERTGELTTANEVKDRLLSVMSHDIRSPLHALRGILQIYNKGAVSKNEFDHFAQHIEDDLNKTSMLVENILYWTANQLKGVQVKMETFDLHVLIRENLQLFETIAAGKKIKLYCESESMVITSDRNILNLVLRNLVSNAIKFSFEHGEVGIYASRDENLLTIRVKDHGAGMDDETLRALTDPELNISINNTNKEKGTGLGLILCRSYLEKEGGQLTVESIAGKGSTFTVLLPVG